MHNCKRTREDLIEMAVSKTPPDRNGSLQAELERCDACREEYASLRNALRSADQAMQSALPAEDFWPAYHARLRQRLESTTKSRLAGQPLRAGVLVRLCEFVTASISVPVPLAAGVFVLLILSVLFTIFSRNALRAAPVASPPSVITKTVEVPVIREKPVTVYVERNRRTARYAPRRKETGRNALTTLARRQRESNPPAGLAGFKPANEVKLTIIKGSYRDDK
jgi:anti-sigma factor RsiW